MLLGERSGNDLLHRLIKVSLLGVVCNQQKPCYWARMAMVILIATVLKVNALAVVYVKQNHRCS